MFHPLDQLLFLRSNRSLSQFGSLPAGLVVQSTSTYDINTLSQKFETGPTFDTLFLFSIAPALLGCCVLLSRALRHLQYRPRWLSPFVREQKEGHNFPIGNSAMPRYSYLVVTFLALSCLGLISQVLAVFVPVPNLTPLPRALTWVGDSLGGFEVVLAAVLALLVLCMPLRDPTLPSDEISPAFEKPQHLLRSPEDNLTLWQWMSVSWMSPLIAIGYTRQLHDEDVWSLSYEFQHRILHHNFRELRGSVVKRLLAANGLDLAILSFLGIVEAFSNFAGPVLLQQLLRAMEDVSAPRSKAITFAVLSLLVRLIACQSSVFSLWFSRRCYERSRGEMITMLYEKTLNRKLIGETALLGKSDVSADEQNGGASETNGNPDASIFKLKISWVLGRQIGHVLGRRIWRGASRRKVEQPASIGKIYNLMRNDVYEVAQRFWEFQSLVRVPLSLVLSIVLVWKLIGWPCLFGVVTVVVAQSVNVLITRILLQYERERRKVTDGKLKKITQYVAAIRHLRWYGWQDFWQEQVMQARQKELKFMVITGFWRALINFANYLASGLFPVAAFYAYTALAGEPLRIDIAFPALQLFGMLENSLRDVPNLITTLLNAKIAVGRIEDFMKEPNKDDAMSGSDPRGKPQAKLQEASFAWPGTLLEVLSNVSLEFPVGLTVICGKVAAGKTALLQALLGELEGRGGNVTLPSDVVGYCAQTPWLQSMSIRDNILFMSPYEEGRYRKVLEACALTQDLATFKHGDLTNIGENGVGLSGGQRARVALARAIYSQAKMLFLDDPLSALDHQTAEFIVQKCFCGPLTEGRTVVLVTHRTALCQNVAKQVVEVLDGQARVLDKSLLPSSETPSSLVADLADQDKEEQQNDKEEDEVAEKFIEDEKRAHGGVKAAVYWEYVKAGKLRWWAVLIFLLALHRLVGLGETWFLKRWGEAYDKPVERRVSSGFFDDLPSPEVNIRPWLVGFFLLAVVKGALFLAANCVMIVVIYHAGRQMFGDVMNRVSHATFRFYDVTPVGRLMNRMTSDIGTVDGNISQQFEDVAFLAISWMRLQMVSLSPLMSNFGALLDGLTTVRAFRAQSSFQDQNITVTDAFQKMDHFYWSLQAWLMYRFDALSACSTFLLTLLALYTGISPGLTAFVLVAASGFVLSTHALCKRYGQLQMDFVSVERIVELLHLEQEPPGSVDPPAWWPSYSGDIVFEDVTIRYAPHLDPSLTGISFRIPAGSTTALLGRTVKPESGRILIDNIDISQVNTQALRNRVTFLAQDPILFPGSMRQNLDPLDEHTNHECDTVLQRVGSSYNWTLDTNIEDGGKNLSQGQRQLVGLARAILRRSSIVILDEATASIDTETAASIQRILRDELKESTVITIAHRLEAVEGADFFIRLEGGKVVESGLREG
ncbi:MAG: hypothetical protein Q9218_004004 [Villophora microphyllina]